jgi:acetyl-CoA C-acetyltransferase
MAKVLKELVQDIEPSAVEDVIIANAVGPMGNIARLSWLEAGLPLYNTATSIDFQCGGGLKATEYAYYQIASGRHSLVIAGGTESTSLEPTREYHIHDPRKPEKSGKLTRAQFAPTRIGDVSMLTGAENTARRYNLSRESMDDYALSSHLKAQHAVDRKVFYSSIVSITVNGNLIDYDETIRASMSKKLLNRAKPLLDPTSRITAGNACLMHDGAAGILLGDDSIKSRYGLKARARILGFSSVGCDPNFSPLGPVYAVENLLNHFDLSYEQIDAMEINEAFAAKILAFHKATDYPIDKINISGGALAYGHPYGASGAIILTHLINNLESIGGGLGIATLGVAGGQGIACLIEVKDDF